MNERNIINLNETMAKRAVQRGRDRARTHVREEVEPGPAPAPVFFVPRFVYTACLWWFGISAFLCLGHLNGARDYVELAFNLGLWGFCLYEREKRDRLVFGPSPYERRRGW